VRLIWATRGRNWGFRFLDNGGFDDPLPEYDAAFAGFEGQAEVFHPVGNRIALRFFDPAGRRDASGRPIPQEFVVFPPLAARVTSLNDGIELVWKLPQVGQRYEQLWDSPEQG
jgi:hypothetical protein